MMLFVGTALGNGKRQTMIVSVDIAIFELCTPILQLIMGLVEGVSESHRELAVLYGVKERLPYLHPV